ncbi:MAG: 23S rRNA (pseudouridine(1915)-N(3))-methyltransferase RlmH [Alphaproteobacteria bacterium]|nr:23S rRNA (pseudouridine(1915)-N(3))-methyltransferase RlmH [Alphaproteobacteria bacterium]
MALEIEILAGGRAKSAPEHQMALAYLTRARDTARALGFSSLALSEVDERKPEKIVEACAGAPLLIALDEHGKSLSSDAFAKQLATWRDAGEARALFVIGGPDGLPAAVKPRARLTLAYGTQTWPHLLVRTMLAEQLFRAMTILSGHPYHRV